MTKPFYQSGETHLHLLAKTLIAERLSLTLPPLDVRCQGLAIRLSEAALVEADRALIEEARGALRPDAILGFGPFELAVEFCITHAVSRRKAKLYEALSLSAIEIDLSNLWETEDPEDQVDAILHLAPRKWIYNRVIHSVEASVSRHIKATGGLDVRGRDIQALAMSQIERFGAF